jgi:hypothetical protein
MDAYKALSGTIQTDYPLLVSTLKSELDLEAYKQIYQEKAKGRKQGVNETVGAYASALNQLIDQAYSGAIWKDSKPVMRMNAFKDGLRKNIHDKLSILNLQTNVNKIVCVFAIRAKKRMRGTVRILKVLTARLKK